MVMALQVVAEQRRQPGRAGLLPTRGAQGAPVQLGRAVGRVPPC